MRRSRFTEKQIALTLRQADEALAVYTRNGWYGSEEVVRQLRLAVAADLRDIRAQ